MSVKIPTLPIVLGALSSEPTKTAVFRVCRPFFQKTFEEGQYATGESSVPAKFIIELLLITKSLINQLNLLCHNISLVEPLYEISSSMIDKSVEARQNLEQANETLTKFLS